MTPEFVFSQSVSSAVPFVSQEAEVVATTKSISRKQASISRRINGFFLGIVTRVRSPQSGDLAAILNDLKALQNEDETDESGLLFRPEPRASNRALDYILKAYRIPSFSRPKIEPDGEGGIVLDWRRGDKIIRLALRAKPNQRDYIYFQSPHDHTAKPASPTLLFDRLQWLTKDE